MTSGQSAGESSGSTIVGTADAGDASQPRASVSERPASLRIRRTSVDLVAVTLELGRHAEDKREESVGAKAGGKKMGGLSPVASASELEAAVRGEEEKEAYGASELASY